MPLVHITYRDYTIFIHQDIAFSEASAMLWGRRPAFNHLFQERHESGGLGECVVHMRQFEMAVGIDKPGTSMPLKNSTSADSRNTTSILDAEDSSIRIECNNPLE